jgi:hypothetical protein
MFPPQFTSILVLMFLKLKHYTPGHVCRQTFIDTYGKAAFRKPYGQEERPGCRRYAQ